MTGRKLYDTLCDAWAKQPHWATSSTSNTTLKPKPIAWPFLTNGERSAFNAAARALTPKKQPRSGAA